MHSDDSIESVLRWRARLEASVRRFDTLLDSLEDSEAGWAPDDGIASAYDHVMVVADAARRMSRRLQDGFEPQELDLGLDLDLPSPELGEILRMLRAHHAAILEQLLNPENLANAPMPLDRLEDLLLDHIVTIGHHAAAILILRQLIDPSRSSALVSPLPQFA